MCIRTQSRFFFFNDTATTEIYTLSLHDALPIFALAAVAGEVAARVARPVGLHVAFVVAIDAAQHGRPRTLRGDLLVALRSEEHTSELQSRQYLVCRLLLEKKKTYNRRSTSSIHA